jgi:hypothetical protein
MNDNNTAYLSNKDDCICFTYKNKEIRFKGPYSLQRIKDVREWDKGYIVVDAVYSHSIQPVEDYIDLIPILEQLYINPDNFLSPITKVEVSNAR